MALLDRQQSEKQMNDVDPIARQDASLAAERDSATLAIVAGATASPNATKVTVWSVPQITPRLLDLTAFTIGLACRGPAQRGSVDFVEVQHTDGPYDCAYVTDMRCVLDQGLTRALFNLTQQFTEEHHEPDDSEDEIPF